MGANYTVVGWLDGQDPNISLTPQEEKKPGVPVLASDGEVKFCLQATETGTSTYKVTALPENATSCEWEITAQGSTTVLTDVATIAKNADGTSATITWKKTGKYTVHVYGADGGTRSETAATKNVDVFPRPVMAALSVSPAGVIVEGQSFTVTASATRGTAPLNYAWLPDQDAGNTFTEPSAVKKTYTFKNYVTDANQCRDTAETSLTVGEKPVLHVDIDSTGILCQNGVTILKIKSITDGNGNPVAPDNLEYTWEKTGETITGNTGATYVASKAGTYTLKVTNNATTPAAEGSDQIVLTMAGSSAPKLAGTTYSILAGKSTYIAPVIAAEGTKPYTWYWSPQGRLDGETNTEMPKTTLLNDNQEYKTYAIDDNGCRSQEVSVMVEVDKNGGNDGGIDIEIIPSSISVCKGNHVDIKVLVNNSLSGSTCSWKPDGFLTGSGQQFAFAPTAKMDLQNWVVTVTKGGKKAMALLPVEVLDSDAPTLVLGTLPGCSSELLEITSTNGATFDWFVNNVAKKTGSSDKTYAFAGAGTYQVDIVAHNGACASDTVSETVTIKAAPVLNPLALASGHADDLICGQDEIRLTLQSGTADSIQWFKGTQLISAPGTKNLTLAVNEAATYKAVAWNGSCASNEVSLTTTLLPQPRLLSMSVTDSCNMARILVDKENGEISWKASGNIPVTAFTDGVHSGAALNASADVTLTLKNGAVCRFDTTFAVKVLPKPEIDFADKTLACNEDIVEVANPSGVALASYDWYKGNLLDGSVHTASYQMKVDGNTAASFPLQVIATAVNGCKDTVAHTFALNPKPALFWTSPALTPPTTVEAGTNIQMQVSVGGSTASPYDYKLRVEHNPGKSYPAEENTNQTGVFAYTADFLKAPHRFTVSVTDRNGCKDTTEVKQTAVNGASLDVQIVSELGDEICIDGSAILRANVTGNGDNDVKYRWYRENNPAENLGDGPVFTPLISQDFPSTAINNVAYGVEVTCEAIGGKGSDVKRLTYDQTANKRAAKVFADPTVVTVRRGESSVLGARAEGAANYTGGYEWHWTPADYLAAGESSLQYPALLADSTTVYREKKFQVYAVNEQGCMSNVADVTVKVSASGAALAVAIDPESKTICAYNSVPLKVKATKGNLTGATYEWLSEGGYLSATGGQTTTFNAFRWSGDYVDPLAAGTYVQVVKVAQGADTVLARNTITVSADQAPFLTFDLEPASYCSGETVNIGSGGAPEGEYTWIVNGTTTVSGNSSMVMPAAGNYDIKVTAKSRNNSCVSDTIVGKVFRIPEIKGVTPNDPVIASGNTVNLTLTLETGGAVTAENWTSLPAGKVATQNATNEGSVMLSTALTENTDFIYNVSNAQANRCKTSDTVHVTIEGPTFEIELGSADSLAICEGGTVPLTVRPSQAGAVNYELTSNAPGFTAVSETVTGSAYTKSVGGWTTEGKYELWIKATNTATAASAYDTVKVTVKPGASIVYADAVGATADFCGTDSVELNLTLGKGSSSSWKVNYLVGAKSIVKDFTNSTSTIKIGEAGTFHFVSVTNNYGCQVADAALPADIQIRNMTPAAVFASTVADSVCLGGDATELAVNVSGGETNYYPYTLFYHKDNGAAEQKLITAAGEVKLDVTGTGTYTLDSIRNKNFCVAKLSGETTVKEVKLYRNGVPEVSFDGADFAACPGQQVIVPLNITGGRPDYTVNYAVGSNSGTATVGADHILRLPAGSQGTLILTQVADRNQCQDADLSGLSAQVTAGQQPTLALTDEASQYSLCSGGGELDLHFTAGQGGPEWILYYQWNGTARKDTIRTADGTHTITLTEGGMLHIDSLLNNLGCRFQPAGGVLAGNITVTDDRPDVAFANADKEGVCLGGVGESAQIELQLSNAGNGPATVWYHLEGGEAQSASVSRTDGIFTLGVTTTGKYTLDSVFYNGCKGPAKNPRTKEIEIGSLPLTVAFDGLTSADICKPGNQTLSLEVLFSGDELKSPTNKTYVLSYHYVEAGLTVIVPRTQEITLADLQRQGNKLKLDGLAAGSYTLVGVSEKGGCSGKVSNTADSVNIMESPVVEIDTVSFAVKAGETYELGVKTGNNYGPEWTSTPANAYTLLPGGNSIQGTMPVTCDDSIQYVLSATNGKCTGYDTVNVYRLPDAPVIRIDTNTNRTSIRLAWNFKGRGKTTGSTLWSSRWDAYALLDPDAYSMVKSSTRVADTVYTIASADLDTLVFFYATADRYIPELSRTFHSGSSDTVGYRYDQLLLHSDTKKTSNNVIPWLFEMDSIQNSADLYRKMGIQNIISVNGWDNDGQGWFRTTTREDMHDFDPSIPEFPNVFDLKRGEAYLIGIKVPFNFLQYGKLQSVQPFNIEIVGGERTNNFVITVGLHSIYNKTTEDLFRKVGIENLTSISLWNFDGQGWYFTTTREDMHDFDPSIPEFPSIFRIFPGMPLQLGVKKNFIWKE